MPASVDYVAGVVGVALSAMPAIAGAAVAVEESGLTTSSAVIVGTVLTGITLPLVRWVLGRLDRSLAQQAKASERQAKTDKAILGLLGVLIKEQREKRAGNQEHHKLAMQALESLQEALQEPDDEEPGEQRVGGEAP